ncbi:MAG TPA: DMT family transporter [Acetobacteraceae bacterium]|nr:DMT family transporter [Acetobacteraceae bacterium]
MPRDRIDAIAASILVVCCMLWGVQQVAIKAAAGASMPPLLQASLRSVVAAALVCGWTLLRGGRRELFARDGSFWPGMGIAALFAVEFLFLYPGMQLTTASRGVVVLYTAPFWVAGGAHLLVPGERLRTRQVVGFLAAFLGVGCAVADGLRHGGGSLIGDGMVALAAAAWGLTTVAVKANRVLRTLSPGKLLLYQLGGSAPILFAFAAWQGELTVATTTPAAWAWLGYQTVVVAFASYLIWFWLITHYPAGRLSAYTFLSPLFGIAAGALILNEHASIELALALLFVAIGIRLVNGPPARPLPRLAVEGRS